MRVLSAATLKFVGVCVCALVCVCVFKWKGHIINTCRTLKFASLRRWRCLSQALSAHVIQWRRGWLRRRWATLIGLLIPCQNYNVNEIMLGIQEQTSMYVSCMQIMMKLQSRTLFKNRKCSLQLAESSTNRLWTVQPRQVVFMWVVWVLNIHLGWHPLRAKMGYGSWLHLLWVRPASSHRK